MKGPTPNPADRMGVYKRLSDVPDRRRLYHHEDAYASRDAWAEYVTETGALDGVSDDRAAEIERVERSWKALMADRGRDHALATPADVEAWAQRLLDRITPRTAYNPYWCQVESFYDWLLWHTDHPHVYHPVLMAADEYEDRAAGRLWTEKLNRTNTAARP